MPTPPIRPRAAAVTALVLASSVLSPPATVRAQEGIGIKVGDTVNVATGQGMVLAIVREAQGHLFKVRIINGPEVAAARAWKRAMGKSTPSLRNTAW
jgi:hypothetical protein